MSLEIEAYYSILKKGVYMYIIKAINLNTEVEWYLRYYMPSTDDTHFESGSPYLFHTINEARYVLGVAVSKRPNMRGWKLIVLKAADKYDNDKFIYCVRCQ